MQVEILNAEISISGIVVAVLANFCFNMVFFSPYVAGNFWLKAIGKKSSELKANYFDYSSAIVSSFATAFFMSLFIFYTRGASVFGSLRESGVLMGQWSDITTGLLVGIFGFIAFGLPFLVNKMVWEGANKNLILINLIQGIISFELIGVIVAIAMDLN